MRRRKSWLLPRSAGASRGDRREVQAEDLFDRVAEHRAFDIRIGRPGGEDLLGPGGHLDVHRRIAVVAVAERYPVRAGPDAAGVLTVRRVDEIPGELGGTGRGEVPHDVTSLASTAVAKLEFDHPFETDRNGDHTSVDPAPGVLQVFVAAPEDGVVVADKLALPSIVLHRRLEGRRCGVERLTERVKAEVDQGTEVDRHQRLIDGPFITVGGTRLFRLPFRIRR